MVIQLTTQPAFPRNKAVKGGIVPRFGNAASTFSEEAGKQVAHLGTAQHIKSFITKIGLTSKDARVGGLSLEDIAGRLQTLIGVYILQGYFAYKDHKHPWETNGRNAVVWLMTLALTTWSKSESYGINTLVFNHFMQEKGTPNKVPGLRKLLLDPLRMDVDYMKILDKAGINIEDKEKDAAMKGQKALWASSWLDSNKVMRIQNYEKELKVKLANGTIKADEKTMLAAIPKFFNRVNIANFGSTAVITLATMYLIGSVAMKIVNKLFTPLDEDTGMMSVKSNKAQKDSSKDGKKNQPSTPATYTPQAPTSYPYPNPYTGSLPPRFPAPIQPSIPTIFTPQFRPSYPIFSPSNPYQPVPFPPGFNALRPAPSLMLPYGPNRFPLPLNGATLNPFFPIVPNFPQGGLN